MYEASFPGVRGLDLNLFHEFRNNYHRGGWSFPIGLADLAVLDALTPHQQKMAAVWRAWFEHMPVRRFPGNPLRTCHKLRLGRTVELFTRTAGSTANPQPCAGQLVSAPCPDADAARTMLGERQVAWLLEGLRSSGATWKLLANAGMMTGLAVGDDGSRHSTDAWDGYGAERRRILSAAAAVGNVVS